MDKQAVDPAVQERIRALCRQITVAHELDAEIQQELYGHMEDKHLAYLAGEEKLSSDDAFILMREHFGSPEALQEFLQAVHEPGEEAIGVRVSLPRRLAAALVATMAIGVPVGLLCSAAVIAFAQYGAVYNLQGFLDSAAGWLHIVPTLISSMLLWYLLVRWQERLAQGQHLWFARWPAPCMWAAAGAAIIAPVVFPKVIVGPFSGSAVPPTWGLAGTVIGMTIWLAIRSIQGLAWLWWSDRAPRTGRDLRWVFLSLLLLGIFNSFYPTLLPGVKISNGAFHTGGLFQTLAEGTIFGTQMHWTLIWAEEWSAAFYAGREGSYQALFVQGFKFFWALAPAILAYGVYRFARRIQRWTAKRHTQGQVIA